MGVTSIVLLLLFIGALEANNCPSQEDLSPCECDFRFGVYEIFCRNFLSPEDLISPMRSLAKSKTEVYSLMIQKSTLLYIPDGVFKNTHIENVWFVDTEIMSLSESDTAFNGLEEMLTEIRATGAKFVSNWDFQQLRNLRKLTLLDIHDMTLNAVDHPFPHLPELTTLGIIDAEISYIVDSAFSALPKLSIFNMNDNDIKELKRSMFPNPANSLTYMDLRQNKLTSLPEDFFDNMTALTDVLLDNNMFTTLTEKPFSFALGNLQQLLMSGNPFRCDCRMRWLVNTRFPVSFEGKCSTPESLLGRSLSTLDYNSLWC